MSLITWVWTVVGAAVVTLAAVHGLAWLLNRRNVSHGIFFCIAVAVACLARLDVAMMHSSTPAEYGEWVRWYQVPAFVFFVVYYFALPVLVGYAPQFMQTKVIGNVNLAYLFALSQFFVAWIIAGLYVKAASDFDRLAKDILEKNGKEGQ